MGGVYVVADAAELAGPADQLRQRVPAERMVDSESVPSPDELSRLAAILRGHHDGEGPSATSELATGIPGLVRLTDQAVLALQGADGDPEMEWEDAVMLWRESLPDGDGRPNSLTGRSDEELLAVIDELRSLVGELVTDTETGWKLYYSATS